MRLDYPAVSAALNRQGCLAHLIRAHLTCLAEQDARLLVQTICGSVQVNVKHIRGSWAYPGTKSKPASITLACDAQRTVQMSSIIHEAAHILDYRKGTVLGHSHHGEPFQRTYARLLRQYVVLPINA